MEERTRLASKGAPDMKITRILCIIMSLAILFTLSGCWDYKEISDLIFVSGFAIDYDVRSEIINVTVEIASTKMTQGGFELTSFVFEESGKNCFDAIRNMIPQTGKKLYWDHTKVLILGQSVFNDERVINDVIDFLDRTVETREDLWMLVSKEKTAGEILKDSETEIENVKSFLLDNTLKNEQSLSNYEGVAAWKFSQELSSPGLSLTLPAVQFLINAEGKKIPQITGEAVIKESKLAGWLDEDEIKYKLMANGTYKGGVYSIDEYIANTSVKAIMELKNAKTEKTSLVSGEQVKIDLNLEIDGMFVEITGDIDITQENKRAEIKEAFRKNIETGIDDYIAYIQNKYASDIFGFGPTVKIQHPKEWKYLEEIWPEIFPNVQVNVSVSLNLLGSSIITKPRELKKE